ncbi:ABC transporter permease [Acidipropionibacterium acidipropionici]|jgi:ABC-type transport system involved in multi-copper enzyme maturation permease subunit|uniref:Uncharacterized protein n=1 Tax=Acidipropionibacterium acidipropionici TaxID=1748 RepID=A0AAC8YH78_9ACTN|nr:ABC transporter permease [Acidipropionibacterium acidipropionici]AMS06409.1 hypothetical protein AXH35_14095 [Acidipropionibacterium acidipropionici]AZP38797.1 ABC transporter permease [Acidipropionibacterium acidipropionici]
MPSTTISRQTDSDQTSSIRAGLASSRPVADQPPSVPLIRLVRAEFRKLTDTRSGFWLLIVIALGAVAGTITTAALWDELAGMLGDWTTGDALISFVPTMLLPVLAILLVTSEWSTRSALTTFTMEPRRGRVMAAKAIVVIATTVVFWLGCRGLTALSALLGGAMHAGAPVSWQVDWAATAGDLASTVLTVAMGLTLAMLFGSVAVSIVVYMAQPLMTSTLALIPGLATAMQWASANNMSLLASGAMTGEAWARVAVSAGIWIVIPAVAGTVLSIRREIK